MQPLDRSSSSSSSSRFPTEEIAQLLAEAGGRNSGSTPGEGLSSFTAQVIRALFEVAQEDPSSESNANEVTMLTEQQRVVLSMLADGFKPREIAERIHVSECTVRSHVYGACKRAGVHSYKEAIKARMDGLVV